jgi:hypothetical protein
MPDEELRAVLKGEHKGPQRQPHVPRTPSRISRRSATSSIRRPRLASLAGSGELLVSVAAAEASGGIASGAERRTLEVRGREATIDVVVLRPAGS